MEGTFHRRPLPSPAVAFSSAEGKHLFQNSMLNGCMEGYFRLAEHYITQGHPAFCGIGSLTVALNTLLLDPKRVWQGVWRWFDESMLSCCEPLDVVRLRGITLAKLGCLAKCNGALTFIKYGSEVTLDQMRSDVKLVCTLPADSEHTVMIVSYSRRALGQSGSGHFSPIGGYDPESDMVLVMDVARFKYPPHWVPLSVLHTATQAVDPDTGRSRGYLLLSPSDITYEQCDCSASSVGVVLSGAIDATLLVPSVTTAATVATVPAATTEKVDKSQSTSTVVASEKAKSCCVKNTPPVQDHQQQEQQQVGTERDCESHNNHSNIPSNNLLPEVQQSSTMNDHTNEYRDADSYSVASSICANEVGAGDSSLMVSAQQSALFPQMIVDDGTQCTFMPPATVSDTVYSDNSGGNGEDGVDGGGCPSSVASAAEVLHAFLNHMCKFCAKQ